MKTKLFLLAALILPLQTHAQTKPADTGKTADFYFIDVGLGNATLVVSPSGETMILDVGTPNAAGRVLETAKTAGAQRIDYMLLTHYHADHYGAAAGLSEKIPVGHFVDHGSSVESGQDDAWWQERRGPWFRPGMGKAYDESFATYEKARAKSGHIIVKPGDMIPVKGLTVQVLTAAGKVIAKPLKRAGGANTACAGFERRAPDDAEAMKAVRNSPGLEDLWQTQKITSGGEQGHNSPDDFIANIGGRNDTARFIKLSAHADGSFTVSNNRNQFSKSYPARKSARN